MPMKLRPIEVFQYTLPKHIISQSDIDRFDFMKNVGEVIGNEGSNEDLILRHIQAYPSFINVPENVFASCVNASSDEDNETFFITIALPDTIFNEEVAKQRMSFLSSREIELEIVQFAEQHSESDTIGYNVPSEPVYEYILNRLLDKKNPKLTDFQADYIRNLVKTYLSRKKNKIRRVSWINSSVTTTEAPTVLSKTVIDEPSTPVINSGDRNSEVGVEPEVQSSLPIASLPIIQTDEAQRRRNERLREEQLRKRNIPPSDEEVPAFDEYEDEGQQMVLRRTKIRKVRGRKYQVETDAEDYTNDGQELSNKEKFQIGIWLFGFIFAMGVQSYFTYVDAEKATLAFGIENFNLALATLFGITVGGAVTFASIRALIKETEGKYETIASFIKDYLMAAGVLIVAVDLPVFAVSGMKLWFEAFQAARALEALNQMNQVNDEGGVDLTKIAIIGLPTSAFILAVLSKFGLLSKLNPLKLIFGRNRNRNEE